MSETKMNIYEKIQAVSNEIGNIEKDLQVGSGSYGYKAVSDNAVISAVNKAEKKHRLLSIPLRQELINSETIRIVKKNGDEGLTYVENIKMLTKIIDLDDITQEVIVESLAKGIDPSDKGFGKASTYARKYGLLNAYKIITGEDPDANKSEETKAISKPSEKLTVLENYFDMHLDTLQAVLTHYSVGTLKDLSDKQVSTIYSTYKQKGLI